MNVQTDAADEYVRTVSIRDREELPYDDDIYARSVSIRGVIPPPGTPRQMDVPGEYPENERKPLLHPNEPPGSTHTRAFFNSLKVFAGAGTFALPWGFDQTGLGLGIIAYLFIAALCFYVMRVFFVIATKEEGVRYSYYDLTGQAYGKKGEIISKVMIIVLIFGIVCSYWILGAGTLAPLLTLDYQIVVLIMLPVYLVLCYLPSLHHIAIASAVGVLSLLVGMAIVVILGFSGFADWQPFAYNWFNWSGLPLFAGSAGFLFFVLPGLVPITLSTSKPKKYPRTLALVFSLISIFNLAFAVICEGLTQPNMRTKQNILDNLPDGTPHDVVRVTLGVEMLLTFPVVIETVFEAIEIDILEFFKRRKVTLAHSKPLLSRNIIRTLVVAVICLITLFVHDFGYFTSFVGSTLASHSTLTIPALVVLKLQKNPWYDWAILVFSILFGVVMSAFGSYQAILGMVGS